MNAREQSCEYANREDVEADYLAGRLEPDAAEAFEAHYFACDACWNRVQRALELRRVLREPAMSREHAAPAAKPHRRAARWWPLAAAAALSSLAIGLYWLQTPSPVFRGAEQPSGFAVEVDSAGSELRVRWTPVPGAAAYELRTLASDGRVLQRMEVEAPAAALEAGTAAPDPGPVLLEVVALDELGQALRRSERVALPE